MIFEEAAGISRFKTQEGRGPAAAGTGRAKSAAAVRHRRRGGQPAAERAGPGRKGPPLQGIHRPPAGASHPGGLVDWRRLTERLRELEGEIPALAEQRDAAAAAAEAIEARLLEVDGQIGEINEAIRQAESQIAANRERIAAQESAIEHERGRRPRLGGGNRPASPPAGRRSAPGPTTCNSSCRTRPRRSRRPRRSTAQIARAAGRRRAGVDRRDGPAGSAARRERAAARPPIWSKCVWPAALASETSALESQATAAAAARQRSRNADGRAGPADRRSRRAELEELRRAAAKNWPSVPSSRTSCWRRPGSSSASCNSSLPRGRQNWPALRQRHTAAAERAAVLEELDRRQEGLSAGVKEVLTQAGEPASPFRGRPRAWWPICFSVSVEVAPLVDVALGQAAQHVVAARRAGIAGILARASRRVSPAAWALSGWSAAAAAPPGRRSTWKAGPGVLGRADRFVETQPRFAPLARRLLGQTWIVEKLAHALELARSAGRGLNFVTLAGELLEADGTLVVGPRQAAAGLISRRSQLRALKTQLAELDDKVAAVASGRRPRCRQQIAAPTRASSATHGRASPGPGRRMAEHRFEDLRRRGAPGAVRPAARACWMPNCRAAETQHETAVRRLAEAREKRRRLDAALAEMEAAWPRLGEQIGRPGGAAASPKPRNHRNQGRIGQERGAAAQLARSPAAVRGRPAGTRPRLGRRPAATGRVRRACREPRAEHPPGRIGDRRAVSAQGAFAGETARAHRTSAKLLQQQRTALDRRSAKDARQGSASCEENASMPRTWRPARSATSATTWSTRLREDYGIDLAAGGTRARGRGAARARGRAAGNRRVAAEDQRLGNVNLEALDELQALGGPPQDAFRPVSGPLRPPRLRWRRSSTRSTPTAGGCSPKRWKP